MIRNTFKFVLAAVLLAVSSTSCSDFLEEDNKVGSTADLTYTTASGISGLVNSCYYFARGWWGKEASLGFAETKTDLFYFGNDNKQKTLNQYDITSATGHLDEYWDLFYSAVDVCNNVMKYVPECPAIGETVKQQYLGEAYFMRALYYSQMVAMWGPIPYNSEAMDASIMSTAPVRLPEEEIYGNILGDLDTSMSYFQSAGVYEKSKASATGHATYYAAQALKARVLLYAASWLGETSITSNSNYSGKNLYSLAQAAAQDVIDNSGASFYTNFNDTWTLANEDITKNNEALWGVHYDDNLSSLVNLLPYRYKTDSEGKFTEYSTNITRRGYSTSGGNTLNMMFTSMWSNGCNDLGGNGKEVFVRVLGEPTSYMTNTATGEKVYVAPYYSQYSRGFTRYIPSVYLWQLFEKNRATDQRVEGTLLTHYNMAHGLAGSAKKYPKMGQYSVAPEVAYAKYGNYFNMGDTAIYYSPLDGNSAEGRTLQAWAKDRYRIQFMSGGDIPVYTSGNPATALPTSVSKPISDVYGDSRYNDKINGLISYPGIRKFLDDVYEEEFPTLDISHRDAVVLRLAEMLLIKAECQLQQSGSAAALSTINELRSVRAIPGQDNSINGIVDINTILEERAIELCGEYQRWFDLKRTHTLLERVKAYNAQASANISEKHYYYPIPEPQIEGVTNYADIPVAQSNGVLQYKTASESFWQNPGY